MKKLYKDNFASKAFDVINVILLAAFSFIVLYPFVNQLAISLNDCNLHPASDITFLPKSFTIDSYKMLFTDDRMLKGALISVLRVVCGTTLTLFCTGLLAYITTVRYFLGRNFLRRVFIIPMYIGGGLIPTYLLMCQLKLLNTFWFYLIPGLFNAYYMLIIASYIQSIPEAMFDAARIDGCNEFGIYTKLVIPTSIPVFAAIAVYLAVGHWNSWFDVLIYNSNGKWDTLQVYLRRLLLEQEAFAKIEDSTMAANKFKSMTTQSLRSATTMVVTIPIVLVYPFLQKYFIGGITIGSVKQ